MSSCCLVRQYSRQRKPAVPVRPWSSTSKATQRICHSLLLQWNTCRSFLGTAGLFSAQRWETQARSTVSSYILAVSNDVDATVRGLERSCILSQEQRRAWLRLSPFVVTLKNYQKGHMGTVWKFPEDSPYVLSDFNTSHWALLPKNFPWGPSLQLHWTLREFGSNPWHNLKWRKLLRLRLLPHNTIKYECGD